MNKIVRIVVMMIAGLGLLVGFGAQTAHADEIRCVGTLGAITVDNVLVPEGRTCTLNKTRVQGTVKVADNATLYAKTVRVNGNIQAEDVAKGSELFRMNCASCHNFTGQGGALSSGKYAPPLAPASDRHGQ